MWPEIVSDALQNKNDHELLIAYQPIAPIWDLSDHSSQEALIRLRHGSEVFPAWRFIDSISGNEKLMLELDRWVLHQVAKRIHQTGHRIAMNVTAYTLRSPFIQRTISESLRNEGISTHQLSLEISEHDPITDTESSVLQLLKHNHIIFLDDVGSTEESRHSLFGYLTYPWVSGLKIDHSLTAQLFDSNYEKRKRTHIVFEMLFAMCLAMDIVCVVEGIEGQDQVEWLHEKAVPGLKLYLQGWAIGMPELES